MAEKRKVSSDVSAALVAYVLKEAKITQEQLAEALEVSVSFISRVKNGERSLTVEHLATFEELIQVPMGVLLIAAMPQITPRPETKKLHDLALKAIAQADVAARVLHVGKSRAFVA